MLMLNDLLLHVQCVKPARTSQLSSAPRTSKSSQSRSDQRWTAKRRRYQGGAPNLSDSAVSRRAICRLTETNLFRQRIQLCRDTLKGTLQECQPKGLGKHSTFGRIQHGTLAPSKVKPWQSLDCYLTAILHRLSRSTWQQPCIV